jgi:hypothetical protein
MRGSQLIINSKDFYMFGDLADHNWTNDTWNGSNRISDSQDNASVRASEIVYVDHGTITPIETTVQQKFFINSKQSSEFDYILNQLEAKCNDETSHCQVRIRTSDKRNANESSHWHQKSYELNCQVYIKTDLKASKFSDLH